jgi:hypothetical protein
MKGVRGSLLLGGSAAATATAPAKGQTMAVGCTEPPFASTLLLLTGEPTRRQELAAYTISQSTQGLSLPPGY